MELTKEQLDIVNSTGNIKINAVAGSGKTTTIIEYAKARPLSSKILYLAFNKSVKTEAIKKFAEKEIYNVKVETAHSLAYKHIVFTNHYKVKAQNYKTHEIVALLGLKGNGEKLSEYILANHINKFISYFCNSTMARVREINYLDVVTDVKAKAFVSTYYDYILKQTRAFLNKMEKGEVEITHDFYLKKFQLSNPKLNYDYILFDEGQDASAAMLDVFLKQKATKVIVGDTHQQIYGWRYAINSLEKADFKTFNLSTSFRFSQDIANMAMEVLKWKKSMNDESSFKINGKGKSEKIKSKAVIARTNLGLLLKAIVYVTERKKVKSIYFEGNINSYTYADEGASLYDVLNLYNQKHHLIKDMLIKQMKNIGELEEYINKTEDVQLRMMLDVAKEFGNKIPGIIKAIKEKHIDNKEDAEMIFTTVHRCKGMEYDAIQLANDFITKEKLEKHANDSNKDNFTFAKLNEEINLLYVAITRSKYSIHIPETLMPVDIAPSKQIHIMRVEKKEEKHITTERKSTSVKESYNNMEKINTIKEAQYTEAYKPWTRELDQELNVMFSEGINVRDLVKHFGRTRGAIRSRIKKLEFEEI